jgi:NitT/TauT family transport system substrate-binding protein
MKRRVWLVVVFGILVIVACIVFLWVGKSSSGKQQFVRIAYLPTTSCLPLFVALEKNYFKDANIIVEPIRLTSTNDAINAVLAGRADGTPGFGLSSFYAIESKQPGSLKIYLPCVEDANNFSNNILVPSSSPIKTISELDGKKIGTYTSSTQLLYLKLMMANVLPPNHKWNIIQVDEKLQIQAFVNGEFDALFALEPLSTKAVNDGIARILEQNPRCKHIFSPFPAGSNCFSASFIEQKPELAKKVAEIFVQAAKDIRSNPSESRAILPQYTPIDSNIATKAGLYEWWLPGEEDFDALQKLADLMFANKLIDRQINVKSMYWDFSKKKVSESSDLVALNNPKKVDDPSYPVYLTRRACIVVVIIDEIFVLFFLIYVYYKAIRSIVKAAKQGGSQHLKNARRYFMRIRYFWHAVSLVLFLGPIIFYFGGLMVFEQVWIGATIGAIIAQFNQQFQLNRTNNMLVTKEDTIDESARLYQCGLTSGMDVGGDGEVVYVMSRCGEFSPYLVNKLDQGQSYDRKYGKVKILIHTNKDVTGEEPYDVYEIFGALLRKYRLKKSGGYDEIESNGIELYLLPDRPRTFKRTNPDGTPKTGESSFVLEAPEHKIVCTKNEAIIGKVLAEDSIDDESLFISRGQSHSVGLWLFRQFEAYINFLSLKPAEWPEMQRWFHGQYGDKWKNALEAHSRSYKEKISRDAAKEDLIPGASDFTNTYIKVLDLCLLSIASASN